jgi:hypothetical protein
MAFSNESVPVPRGLFCCYYCNAEREFHLFFFYLQGKAGHSHLNNGKSPARKNRLSQTAYSEGRQTVNLKKLLPYG